MMRTTEKRWITSITLWMFWLELFRFNTICCGFFHSQYYSVVTVTLDHFHDWCQCYHVQLLQPKHLNPTHTTQHSSHNSTQHNATQSKSLQLIQVTQLYAIECKNWIITILFERACPLSWLNMSFVWTVFWWITPIFTSDPCYWFGSERIRRPSGARRKG